MEDSPWQIIEFSIVGEVELAGTGPIVCATAIEAPREKLGEVSGNIELRGWIDNGATGSHHRSPTTTRAVR